MGRNIAPLLAASLLPAYALAQQTSDADPVEEIVVTAAPLGRAADDLTQPVTVLADDELTRKVEASIGETLANELGVSTTYFGPVAGRPVIRGQAGPRVTVLEDGVGALDVSDLSPDHAVSVEPLFADRIEVIRGPATLLYGSGAAGGVVNVIDNRIPEALTASPVSAALEIRGDTAAEERAVAARMDGSIGMFAWHFDAVDRQTRNIDIPGFATADPADRPADEASGTLLNSFSESLAYAGGASLVGDRGFIGVSLSRYESDYGLPGPEEAAADDPLVAEGPFIELEQTRFDLRSEYTFAGPFETLRLRFGQNDYEHTEIEPTGEAGTRFENDAWEARIELEHTPLGNWRGALGLQVADRDFSALGDEAFVPPTRSKSQGLFLLEERRFDNGRLEIGARLESLEHAPFGSLPTYDETAVSVAAGITWDFLADYELNVNLSRSERNPDAAELYSNGPHLATGLFEVGLLVQSADAVEQEVATNLDVSVHHHHGGAYTWEIGVFYNDIANYIFRSETATVEAGLPLTPYVQQDARFYGYEAEIEVQLGQSSGWSTRWFTDYVRARTDQGFLPRIQPRRFGAELRYVTTQLSTGMQAIWHAEQDDISSFQTGSFTLLNADLIYRVEDRGPLDWQIFLKGSNLLDEEARRSTSFRAAFVPLPGISLHAGLRAFFD